MYPSSLLLFDCCCVALLCVQIAYHQRRKCSYCLQIYLKVQQSGASLPQHDKQSELHVVVFKQTGGHKQPIKAKSQKLEARSNNRYALKT